MFYSLLLEKHTFFNPISCTINSFGSTNVIIYLYHKREEELLIMQLNNIVNFSQFDILLY